MSVYAAILPQYAVILPQTGTNQLILLARMSGIVLQPVTVSDHITRSPIAQIKGLILGVPNAVAVNSHASTRQSLHT